jgi:hypothetical protein
MRFCTKKIVTLAATLVGMTLGISSLSAETNPIFKDVFTADPAPLVYKDTVYAYVGHDEAKGKEMFTMKEWLCYSSKDMKTWTAHGSVLKATDFKWVKQDAWAAQVVEKDGKFYYYVATQHDQTHPGMAIGVAVADNPLGPFKDARGSALITDEMTPGPNNGDDIDPTVLIDDDGTPWMAWGNPNCYMVKLKPNMIELDGKIERIDLPNYTEGPWLHKHDKTYYIVYPAFAHQAMQEKLCYATATKITGPWTYRGILTENAKNSYTIHPGVLDFKGQGYLFYHNATLELNGEKGAIGRRSVCMEYLYYNPDGTIQPIKHTVEGVSVPPKPGAPTTPKKVDPGVTDPGVKFVQSPALIGATRWPDKPLFATVENPWNSVHMDEQSFNDVYEKNVPNIGQSFSIDADCKLKRISIYGGDGLGTDTSTSTLTLALYDLGVQVNAAAPDYKVETNLFGNGKGLKVAYEVQATGILQFDFVDANQVDLKAGHTYVFELQGTPGSAPVFWRRTPKDVFAKGSAYRNRSLLRLENASPDFAIAVYAADKAGN